MNFILDNIFSRFGCPRRLVTDTAQAFKSAAMVDFCNKYNIILSHSTPYYPQGNGLAESSNKSLVRIIKKLLAHNKRAWDSKLKFALWADRISTKKSIGTSPFQLVYGTDAVIPLQLGIPMMKFFQEEAEETNDLQRRMFQPIHLSEERERVNQKALDFKDKMKVAFDKKVKKEVF